MVRAGEMSLSDEHTSEGLSGGVTRATLWIGAFQLPGMEAGKPVRKLRCNKLEVTLCALVLEPREGEAMGGAGRTCLGAECG